MIKKFLNKVFKKRQQAEIDINQAERNVVESANKVPFKKHKIDKTLISSAALKTCEEWPHPARQYFWQSRG